MTRHIIFIGDGMGDRPVASLGGLTPVAAARTPNLDRLASGGLLGLARTTPENMPCSSDVCIMSLLGYDPRGVLTGRGPLEALARNVDLPPGTLAFRLNLVTLELGAETVMRDHSAGDIPDDQARILVGALGRELFRDPGRNVYPGVSYRNVLTWRDAPEGLPSVQPHDFLGREVGHILDDPAYAPLAETVRASWPILAGHPVNRDRAGKGLNPANSVWLWGQGKTPGVRSYRERWGLRGATVSAVDIIRGLARATGLEPLDVPGATGTLDTNYEGKARAASLALRDNDLVVVHLEAPDETSHQGRLDQKLQAIENFDRLIVGPVVRAAEELGGDFRVLCACDHLTPLELRTHTADPVPFLVYDSRGTGRQNPPAAGYSEAEAAKTGLTVPDGPSLGRLFLGPEIGGE
ncbi:MAG: cofactor-independent phosphoglycerate mutase [Deltaproteobacteria bacterium]|jgi:2,3-bisphosphoglycerate-independent phosphoglycerate mutase|nr:cofactor-independent phosphoglycerate mutase [Deltaproteobacteria bacterium]